MLRLQPTLPARYCDAEEEALQEMIGRARTDLGDDLVILGHHYQREEVYRWADATGDSFKLAQFAANTPSARWVVFLGVHFMAESADILTGEDQRVILPDLNAGCSMADMADIDQVEECWDDIAQITDVDRVIPITYMNSSAAIKAFVGERGGAVCTSSNCRAILEWALERGGQVLFLPDQHLGRNTARDMGFAQSDEALWNPARPLGGLDERSIKESTFLLWRGHCSVHQRFTPQMVDDYRRRHPDGSVIVHPECSHEVVAMADFVGSTEGIKKTIAEHPEVGAWGVGTEIHLVERLGREYESVSIESLDPIVCPCSTMFRIDAPHLAWCLDRLLDGEVVNQIEVDQTTAAGARLALERMLSIT